METKRAIVTVLIHTFNKYSFLWEGCLKAWETNCSGQEIIFGSDYPCENDIYIYNKRHKVLYSGPGEWSDRLRRLLIQIPTDYVLYCQEDHYPNRKLPKLSELMEIVSEHDLLRLQISPINQFYSVFGDKKPYFFHPSSKYLVSHQPSIWRKDFLLSCLHPEETPWDNEYKGTLRLNNKPEIEKKIAIYPYNWYDHMCSKGKLIK